MPYEFQGDLSYLNKKVPQKQGQLLTSGFIDQEMFAVTAGTLDQLAEWLEQDIIKTRDHCKAAQPFLTGFITKLEKNQALVRLSANNVTSVGHFLAQALRATNHALYDVGNIDWYVKLFGTLGIPLSPDSNLDKCRDAKSFSDVAYIPAARQVRLRL